MWCLNCQRENDATNRFCIHCGAALSPQDAAQKPEQVSAGDNYQQLQSLRQDVNRLRESANRLNERLNILENNIVRGGTKQEPILPPATAPIAPQFNPPLSQVAPTGPIPQKIATPSPQTLPPVSTPAPQTAPPPRPPQEPKPVKTTEWEQILGGNWLARIGVLALIIGVGFFLKMAFDNNWIGPSVRIILGTLTGLGLLTGGYFWRARYPVLAQAISGGGIAILYISFFAAFAAFQLIPFLAAVILLFLVSGGSAILAIRYDSMALAILGILGAFLLLFF